MRLIY